MKFLILGFRRHIFLCFRQGEQAQPLFRCAVAGVYFVNLVDFVGFGFQPGRQELLYVEGVPWIGIGCQVVVGMFRDVVFVRKERTDAAQLQDALAAVHDGDFILRHELLPQLLIIERVGGFPPTALAGVVVE